MPLTHDQLVDQMIDNLYRSIDQEADKLAQTKNSCREAEILRCLQTINPDLANQVTKALDETLAMMEMDEIEKLLVALKSSE